MDESGAPAAAADLRDRQRPAAGGRLRAAGCRQRAAGCRRRVSLPGHSAAEVAAADCAPRPLVRGGPGGGGAGAAPLIHAAGAG